MAATPTIGFVIDAIRKMAAPPIGSVSPNALRPIASTHHVAKRAAAHHVHAGIPQRIEHPAVRSTHEAADRSGHL